jgi:hypothetical protein
MRLANLGQARAEMDELWVYDNSRLGGPPKLIMRSRQAVIRFLIDHPPSWLALEIDNWRKT